MEGAIGKENSNAGRDANLQEANFLSQKELCGLERDFLHRGSARRPRKNRGLLEGRERVEALNESLSTGGDLGSRKKRDPRRKKRRGNVPWLRGSNHRRAGSHRGLRKGKVRAGGACITIEGVLDSSKREKGSCMLSAGRRGRKRRKRGKERDAS